MQQTQPSPNPASSSAASAVESRLQR